MAIIDKKDWVYSQACKNIINTKLDITGEVLDGIQEGLGYRYTYLTSQEIKLERDKEEIKKIEAIIDEIEKFVCENIKITYPDNIDLISKYRD